MASQANGFDDLLELLRQIEELYKARMGREAQLLSKRFDQALDGLQRQMEDLRKAGKYAEAVPLAERLVQVEELQVGKNRLDDESLGVAGALINLWELLIATGRSAEAEPLLQRALAIVLRSGESLSVAEAAINSAELLITAGRSAEAELLLQRALAIVLQDQDGKTILRERFSQINTGKLVDSVSALRSLLYDVRGAVRYRNRRMSSMDLAGGRDPEEGEAEEQRVTERLTRWLEEDRRRQLVLAGAAKPVRLQTPAAHAPTRGHLVGTAPTRPAPDNPDPGVMASTWRQPAERIDLASFASRKERDPSTPEGALAIEAGRLAYQIPDRMWVGVQETVEVRLGAVIAKEIAQGFVGRGDVKLEHVPIVETMSVSLVCQPGTFEIESRSNETQLVKPDLVKGTAFHQDDFARWVWIVTPRQRGKHTLFVKVSAAIKDSRGLPTTSSLPDKIIAVTVRVDLARAASGAFWRVAPGLAWAVATTLVGIFTHDYWWPYLRDTILPAVRAMAGMP